MYRIPPHNGRQNENIILRGYIANNEPLQKTEIVIPDNIDQILDNAGKIFINIEYYYDNQMPANARILIDKNCTDIDLIAIALRTTCLPQESELEEIIITPVYQKIEGYPKVFDKSNEQLSVLITIQKSTMNRMMNSHLMY